MPDNYRFDVPAFIKDLGGPAKVAERLAEIGIPVKATTVKKWRERDDIGLVYVTNLLAAQALAAKPLSFQAYITRDHRPGGARAPRGLRRPSQAGE